MNFTEQQQKAVDYSENISAAVSASAGSGKTAVLVEHIAKIISDEKNPVPADRIAAVTFTEKAAAELKSRLERRMEQLILDNPCNDFYRDQLVRLSFAQISTISSFCLSLVKDNIRLLPLDEGISVIDDVKSGELSDKAEKLMLKRFYKELSSDEQGEFYRLLGGEKQLAYLAKQLYKFFSNIPDPTTWINDQLDIYGSSQLFEDKYVKPYRENTAKALNMTESMLDETIDEIRAYIISDKPIKKAKGESELSLEAQTSNLALKGVPYFENLKGIVTGSKAAFQNNDLDLALEEASKEQGRSPSFGGNENLSRCVEVKEKTKASIEEFKTSVMVLINWDKDRVACFETLKKIYYLERIYEEEFSQLKRSNGFVDFSDLEKYALAAVRKGAGKGRFDYIIVDEFQDSNDIQYEIFRELSKDEKNLYFVGDEKQCIYAFRNANPEIFTSRCKDSKYNNIKLTKNFRSSADVINTVNLLFSADNKPRSFSENPWEDMSCGRGIHICDKNKSELVKVYAEGNTSDRELMYVAARIQKMVQMGFTVHSGDKERPCSYGDFAVLTRRNETAVKLRKIMEDYNIPAVSVGEKEFTNLVEVEQVLAVLSAVIRPNDNISVAKALMSPAYGFTAEDMARVRLAEGTDIENPKNSPLYTNLSKMDKAGVETVEKDSLHQKIHRFITDMKLLRKEASGSTTSALIRKIYSVTALDQIMSVGLKGKERLANLRLLVRYGKDYPRPADFIAAMKNIKSSSEIALPQAQVKEQEEKSVKLMSIHASKGLQFPVVFVAETNISPNTRDRFLKMIYNFKEGVGISVTDNKQLYKYKTLSHNYLEKGYLDRVLGEELRLLYVAMTRAEEKLIVTTSAQIKEKEKKSKNGTTEYIEEEAPPTADSYYGFIYKRLEEAPAMMNLVEVEEDREIVINNEAAQNVDMPDFELIRKKLEYEYPYKKLTDTPAKFTATALGVKADEGENENTTTGAFYLGLPVFIKKGKPLTPKERGDLYHKVMENLDFTAKNAAGELNRLVREGVITEKERGEIKAEEIQGFLESSLCQRAVGAEEVNREFPVFTTVNAANTENPENEDLSFIQGIADMFFTENGEIVLADYKTNRNTTPQKLTEEYKGQLSIYKKALEEMTGLRVKECWLYSFSLGQCVRVDT